MQIGLVWFTPFHLFAPFQLSYMLFEISSKFLIEILNINLRSEVGNILRWSSPSRHSMPRLFTYRHKINDSVIIALCLAYLMPTESALLTTKMRESKKKKFITLCKQTSGLRYSKSSSAYCMILFFFVTDLAVMKLKISEKKPLCGQILMTSQWNSPAITRWFAHNI